MSIKLMSAAWETTLGATKKIVLLALCDNASDEGVCRPTVATIARKSSLSERSVFRVLAELEAAGYVRRDGDTGAATQYHVRPVCQWPGKLSTTPDSVSGVTACHGCLASEKRPKKARNRRILQAKTL